MNDVRNQHKKHRRNSKAFKNQLEDIVRTKDEDIGFSEIPELNEQDLTHAKREVYDKPPKHATTIRLDAASSNGLSVKVVMLRVVKTVSMMHCETLCSVTYAKNRMKEYKSTKLCYDGPRVLPKWVLNSFDGFFW